MKNWKKVMAILISAIVLFCNIGINTFAAENEASSKIKVYDSNGNLIDELIKYGINTKTRIRE